MGGCWACSWLLRSKYESLSRRRPLCSRLPRQPACPLWGPTRVLARLEPPREASHTSLQRQACRQWALRLVQLSKLDLRPQPPLPGLQVSVAALAVFPLPVCRSSRPGHAIRRRRSRLCLPSSPSWTEIDGVWMSLFPAAPRRSRRRLGRQRINVGAERFRQDILLRRRPVLPPVHRPVFAFHFGTLECSTIFVTTVISLL